MTTSTGAGDPARADSDPSATPSVSVVVCAYTEARWDALVVAVDALARQTLAPLQVIVCIDHNEALFARACAAFGGACVVANEHERGLSGARNTGIAYARGSIVAFLDDDAWPEPDWLERLVAAFQDPRVVGAGGIALPEWVEGRPPGWLPPEMYWVVGCSYLGLPSGVSEMRNPIGANMAFRRDALAAAGGFENGIGRVGSVPLGCEETELAIRVQRVTRGVVLHVPPARVHHLVPAPRVTWRYFLRRCWAEGVSKARVARRAGAHAALASERAYVRRTLPRGCARGVREALAGDVGGVLRAAAIVVAVLAATGGYLRGTLAARSMRRVARFALAVMVGGLPLVAVGGAALLTSREDGRAATYSGPRPPPAPGSWKLKFRDEFNGSRLDRSKWHANWLGESRRDITKPVNDDELSCYDPRQVREGRGLLTLTAVASSCRASDGRTYRYRSGLIQSRDRFEFTYGYMEARIRIPHRTGRPIAWPAFWANGTGAWPRTGEIDVVEVLHGGELCWHFRYEGGAPGGCPPIPNPAGWHTFGAAWEPDSITFYYDRVEVGRVTRGVTGSPMFLVANLGIARRHDRLSRARMHIDYIRVWQH